MQHFTAPLLTQEVLMLAQDLPALTLDLGLLQVVLVWNWGTRICSCFTGFITHEQQEPRWQQVLQEPRVTVTTRAG